jgi:hypothetical protein
MTGEIRYNSTIGYAAATSTPTSIDFGAMDLGDTPPATKTVTVTSTGSSSEHFGAAAFTGFQTSSFKIVSDTCSNQTVPTGSTCTIGVQPSPVVAGTLTAILTLLDSDGFQAVNTMLQVGTQFGKKGTYYPVGPERLLDTRQSGKHPIGAKGTLNLKVAGVLDIPATGVGAVVLNLTVTGGTSGSYMTVYPTGTGQPTASSINFTKGQTLANGLTVKVGQSDQVSIYNSAGSAQVIVDIVGYYASDDSASEVGGAFQALTAPERLVDTRKDGGALPGGYEFNTWADWGDSVNYHIRAFAVNVTVTGAKKSGYLTLWNGMNSIPTASTINYAAGTTLANSAIVPTEPCGEFGDPCGSGTAPSITVYNGSAGSTQVIIDIIGFYDDSNIAGGGLRFVPIAPTRIVDTRSQLGAPGPIGTDGATINSGNVKDAKTWALSTNITAIKPTKATYLTVWEAAINIVEPTASNLNVAAGQTIANGVTTGIGPDSTFNIANAAGSVDVLVDVNGLFDYFPFDLNGDAAKTNSPAAITARNSHGVTTGHSTVRPGN